MGLPIWKPKRGSLDEIQEDVRKRHSSFYERNTRQLSAVNRAPVLTRHNSSNESSPNELTPLEIYDRISRRGNASTSLPTERWQNQESFQSSTQRDELERIEQFITEKKNLLEQLQVTSFLLEQFLTARTRLGADAMNVPEFITRDLPTILESAAALAAMSPAELVSSFSPSEISTNVYGQSMVEALLSTPPYSLQIQEVEASILSAHRRIRRQLRSLAISRQGRRHSPTSSNLSLSSRSSPPFHPSSNFRSPSTRLSRRIRFVDRDASP